VVKQQLLEDLKNTIESLGYQTSDIVLSIPKNPWLKMAGKEVEAICA